MHVTIGDGNEMLFTTREEDVLFERYRKEAFAKADALVTAKGDDYNRGVISTADYFPNGWRDALVHVWKTSLRLLSISRGGKIIKTEGMEDTLLDLLNWGSFMYAMYKIRRDRADSDQS